MASEETPLLQDAEAAEIEQHEVVYNRFSVSQKRVIVALVSWSALMPSKSVSYGDVAP